VIKIKGWDGKLNGTNSPGGGFIYLLSFKESSSTELKVVKGHFYSYPVIKKVKNQQHNKI